MKITEVTKQSDARLFESIDATNDTGFLTEDLVKVVRTHEANEWSEGMTSAQLSKLIESWSKK